jgi:CDP-diacylglycerol--glycerol-3-phosphate 3-phosphatidyltransferase
MVLSALRSVFLRVLSPVADFLIERGVSPNAITTFGTVATVIGGGIYARGHIHAAGWVVGLSAICDLLDGHVARRSGRTTAFGAFYDSTLDRIADGAVLGGLALFFARNGVHHAIPNSMSTPMVSVLLLGILGSFLTSYTRARAEGLGIDAKVGILQRPERIFLLAAPQAFFGLALGGWVLITICILLTVTAWITVIQRVLFVYRSTAAHESRAPAEASLDARPSSTAEREAYGARGGWFGGIAQLGDRMFRGRENADARLADVAPPADPTPRRTEAGHPTTFDRAR